MAINRKSIATVTAGLLAGGAIGFAAGVPGLTSAADAPMVDTVDADLDNGDDHVDRASRIREVLQPLVDDATIDGDQADAVAQHLAESMPGRGQGHRGGRAVGAHAEVVTDLLGIDAETLRKKVKDRFDILLAGGQDHLKGKVFRIGHLGLMTDVMALAGIATAEMVMADLGLAVTPGSGTAAAQGYYRATARSAEAPGPGRQARPSGPAHGSRQRPAPGTRR